MVWWTCRGIRAWPPRAGYSRSFSARTLYSSFPASLAYYRPRSRSRLSDHRDSGGLSSDMYDEGVHVADDGLVYPGMPGQSEVTNGAVLYAASTFMMQEMARQYYDDYLSLCEAGETAKTVEVPHIYTVPKNTPVPSHFILTNDYLSRFTLQPSRGMLLSDLNSCLDDFFDAQATKEEAGRWIDSHPYASATPDDAIHVWMKV